MVLTPPETPPAAGRPFSILIADDDKGNRETLSDLLRARGFSTVLAADGGEAVDIIRVELVHLVLIDLHMPRLTGFTMILASRVVRSAQRRTRSVVPSVEQSSMTMTSKSDMVCRSTESRH